MKQAGPAFFVPSFMIYLIGSIISSTSIFIIFRISKNTPGSLIRLISINYFTATLLGFILFSKFNSEFFKNFNSWYLWSMLLGFLFIAMFFLIGISTQKTGITATTLANKLSLIFPVLFSLIYFNEKIPFIKYIGLFTSLIAIFLTIYKKDFKKNYLIFILPFIIFFGSGLTDSVVKLAQGLKTKPEDAAAFSTFVFASAFVISMIIAFFFRRNTTKSSLRWTVPLGVLLGIANFGSLYFIINALNKSNLESSLVFAVNNTMVVALSALFGNYIFNEKLNRLNLSGILLALISLYFLI